MREREETKLQLERTVFFCDAVIAIAITLLALNLKVGHVAGKRLQFSDILSTWKIFAAFILSFINIAGFWRTHHIFFTHIKKVNDKLLGLNILWLFFIVILPFSTSLVSDHFFDTPAIFVYSINIFLISVFQNSIWDYACRREDYITDTNDELNISRIRIYCNVDMINSLLAVGLSFFNPALAFILLFTKIPMIVIFGLYTRVVKKRAGK